MLWVEMHETLLFRSPSFTRFVAKTIFDLLRNISETVFSPVGFLDVRDFWAWEYQADLPNEMEGKQDYYSLLQALNIWARIISALFLLQRGTHSTIYT
jgi:hypothetical protein